MTLRLLLRASSRLAFGLLLSLLATSEMLQAQDRGLLRTAVEMPDTDEFVRNQVPGHRSYVELDAIRFTIEMGNESMVPLVVDQVKLHDAYAVHVGGDAPIAADLRWIAIQGFEADRPAPLVDQEPVLIKPQEFVKWTVAIHRADGKPFTWGDYPVSLELGDVRRAVSTLDGRIWDGRLMEKTVYERLVSVKAPRTSGETARRHSIAAMQARARGDTEAGLQAMILAAAADPSLELNVIPWYVRAGRYQEAIAKTEERIARGLYYDRSALDLLAYAYVAVGEYNKATGTLQRAGVPQADVADALSRVRQRVADRVVERAR